MKNEGSENAAWRFSEQVTDPEDYNRTQRFKEIHDARQRVSQHVADMELPDAPGDYLKQEAARLAYLVSLYIYELEPLIAQSDIDDGDIIPEGAAYTSLRDFAGKMGYQNLSEDTRASPPKPQTSMRFFSAANRFYARVGMDLEMEKDKGDAGFDYSDILEEGPPGDAAAPSIEEIGD